MCVEINKTRHCRHHTKQAVLRLKSDKLKNEYNLPTLKSIEHYCRKQMFSLLTYMSSCHFTTSNSTTTDMAFSPYHRFVTIRAFLSLFKDQKISE